MSKKTIGWVGVAGGAIAVVLSLLANPLRIGTNPAEFGWLQSLGAVLGLLAVAGGLWFFQPKREAPARRKPNKRRKSKT